MRGSALRIVVLLWLGWYLSGPLAETVDRWDGPRQEFHDIQFNAGGGVVVIAAVFSFAFLFAKKFRERYFSPLRNAAHVLSAFIADDLPIRLEAPFNFSHSPPFPIRI